MSGSAQIASIHQLHALWNDGDLSRIPDIYHPDFLAHRPGSSETPQRSGFAGVEYGIKRIRTAFPDWTETVLDTIEQDDRVVTRYISTGTHEGVFWGIEPTGRSIEIEEMSIYRFQNSRVIEQWCLCDELARLHQLGLAIPRTIR